MRPTASAVLLIATLCCAATTHAQVPRTISYQGSLFEATGTPVADGAYTVVFRLYADLAGGTSFFSETQSLQVVRGSFSAIIGGVTPGGLPTSISFASPYYLGLSINGAAELSPRTALTASPYALNAAGLSLPAAQTVSSATPLLSLTNTGNALGSIGLFGAGITGVKGEGTTGSGVFGFSPGGIGVQAASESGTGLYAASITGTAATFFSSGSGPAIAAEALGNADGITGRTYTAGKYGLVGRGPAGVLGAADDAGDGVTGTSVNGVGVRGESNDAGVLGLSTGGTGVFGGSTDGNGVLGSSSAADDGFAGVSGVNTAGNGVLGSSTAGRGVYGISDTYRAVEGKSRTGVGVFGASEVSIGVFGDGVFAGVLAYSAGTDSAALVANHTGPSGNIARFQSASTTVARIDKTGKGFFNGGTQASGADVAEAFDVEDRPDTYEPGDVLVISAHSNRTLDRSTSAYSPHVAGVFATRPGLLLSDLDIDADASHRVPLGMVGVIPTKVSAENGPIRRGDLLVTAATPGHAMKSASPAIVGTVLGKALEPFDGPGTGVIAVLVNVK